MTPALRGRAAEKELEDGWSRAGNAARQRRAAADDGGSSWRYRRTGYRDWRWTRQQRGAEWTPRAPLLGRPASPLPPHEAKLCETSRRREVEGRAPLDVAALVRVDLGPLDARLLGPGDSILVPSGGRARERRRAKQGQREWEE
jgi:hypothetical protein